MHPPAPARTLPNTMGTGGTRLRIENTRVVCLGRSPMGDPSAYLIRGTVIALRRCDCRGIRVAVT